MRRKPSPLWLLLIPFMVTAGLIVRDSMRRLPPIRPLPSGTFAFAALGDAPYSFNEEAQYRAVLGEIAGADVVFALHVGDIADSCKGDIYTDRLRGFSTLPLPLVYTPGDNEWTDCAKPLERLALIRRTFFSDPGQSLGARPLALEHQQGEFTENARWVVNDVVFATLHLVGSGNGTYRLPPEDTAEAAEVVRRTHAAAAWTAETFARARAANAPAVVLAFHASAPMDVGADSAWATPYEPALETLEREAAAFGGPVLVVHGDAHTYRVDRPLRSRATGRRIDNLVRLEVPGSPDVAWVRVIVDLRAPQPFSFESRVQPRFKLW